MKADLILAGGRVRTLGRSGLRSSSHIAIAGGLVAAVGGREVLELRAAPRASWSLPAAPCCPASTTHTRTWSTTPSPPTARISPAAAASPRCRAVYAVPRLDSRLARGCWGAATASWSLPRDACHGGIELDIATGDRPAFIDHRGGHSRVANSAALAAAGLGPGSPDPPGGLARPRRRRSLDGLLAETAMRLVADHRRRPPSRSATTASRRPCGCWRRAASPALEPRSTAVSPTTTASTRPWPRKGVFEGRVNEFLSWELLPALRELGFETAGAGALVRFGPVKVFVDGGAGSGTAALRGRDGPWRTPPAELAALVRDAQRAACRWRRTAWGTAPSRPSSARCEAAQRAHPGKLRHRVEHCTYCPPDLQEGLARARMSAVMQPLFSSFGRARLGNEIGPGAERHVAAHRDLFRAGVKVAFSSDLPVVADPNPWAGLAAAVTDSEQPLTTLQALRAYTVGGAWTSSEEGVKGTLDVGRLADFQVYPEDPLELSPDKWPALRPRLVALAGRPVTGSFRGGPRSRLPRAPRRLRRTPRSAPCWRRRLPGLGGRRRSPGARAGSAAGTGGADLAAVLVRRLVAPDLRAVVAALLAAALACLRGGGRPARGRRAPLGRGGGGLGRGAGAPDGGAGGPCDPLGRGGLARRRPLRGCLAGGGPLRGGRATGVPRAAPLAEVAARRADAVAEAVAVLRMSSNCLALLRA